MSRNNRNLQSNQSNQEQPKPLLNAEDKKEDKKVIWESSNGDKLVSRRFPTRVLIKVANNKTGKYQYKHTYSINVMDLTSTAFKRAVGLELGRRLAYQVREKQGQRLDKEEIQTILDTLNGIERTKQTLAEKLEQARREERERTEREIQTKNCISLLRAKQYHLAQDMFSDDVINKAREQIKAEQNNPTPTT